MIKSRSDLLFLGMSSGIEAMTPDQMNVDELMSQDYLNQSDSLSYLQQQNTDQSEETTLPSNYLLNQSQTLKSTFKSTLLQTQTSDPLGRSDIFADSLEDGYLTSTFQGTRNEETLGQSSSSQWGVTDPDRMARRLQPNKVSVTIPSMDEFISSEDENERSDISLSKIWLFLGDIFFPNSLKVYLIYYLCLSIECNLDC